MAMCTRYKTYIRVMCDLQSVYALHWQIGVDTIAIITVTVACTSVFTASTVM